jgi:cation diffusion facilitator family transporter
MLAGTGVAAGYHSVSALFTAPVVVDSGTSLYVLGAAVVSIGAKEVLYRATLKVAEQEHSLVLAANAWHHRSDALSSVVALVGVAGSLAGVPLADPVGGIVIAGLILRVSADLFHEAFKELTDTTLTAAERQALVEVASSVPGVRRVKALRARPVGGRVLVGSK